MFINESICIVPIFLVCDKELLDAAISNIHWTLIIFYCRQCIFFFFISMSYCFVSFSVERTVLIRLLLQLSYSYRDFYNLHSVVALKLSRPSMKSSSDGYNS